MDSEDPLVVPHFRRSELACSHCGDMPQLNTERTQFLWRIVAVRERVASPMIVTSYYRCPSHPLSLERPTSTHVDGIGMDLKSRVLTPTELCFVAMDVGGFHGYGVSEEGGFLHLDRRPGRIALWTYEDGRPITALRADAASVVGFFGSA